MAFALSAESPSEPAEDRPGSGWRGAVCGTRALAVLLALISGTAALALLGWPHLSLGPSPFNLALVTGLLWWIWLGLPLATLTVIVLAPAVAYEHRGHLTAQCATLAVSACSVLLVILAVVHSA